MSNYEVSGLKLKNDISLVCHALMREYDIGAVLDRLENLIILPATYKIAFSPQELFEHNKEVSNHTMHIAKHNFNKLKKEKDMRCKTFRAIRSIYPDFSLDIIGSLSDSDKLKYMKLKHQYTLKINKLNDFLYDNASYPKLIQCNYDGVWLKTKDIVADIVDLPETNELAFMQDNYILNELRSIDYAKFNDNIQNNIEQIKNTVQRRIAKYALYKNPRRSKNNFNAAYKDIDININLDER